LLNDPDDPEDAGVPDDPDDPDVLAHAAIDSAISTVTLKTNLFMFTPSPLSRH
jgi:hypothetical protein